MKGLEGRNFLGHPVDWVWVMRKLNTPFSVSTYPIGFDKGADVFDYHIPMTAAWYDFGDIYFDKEEMLFVKKFLAKKIEDDPRYTTRLSKRIFSLAKKIQNQEILIKKDASLQELLQQLKNSRRYFEEMIGFMSYRGSIQVADILEEKLHNCVALRLSDIGKLREYSNFIEVFNIPLYPSVVAVEKRYVLTNSIGFGKLAESEQTKRINAYRDNYEWLSYHWLVGTPPSNETIFKRYSELEAGAKEELVQEEKQVRGHEEEVRLAMKELNLSRSERSLVEQFRAWLFLRTFVKDSINQAGYKLLPLLNCIGEKFDIQSGGVPFLTISEIDNISGIPAEELKNRIQGRKNGFSAGLLNGEFLFAEFKKEESVLTADSFGDLRGSVAFKGIVRGIARVLMFPKEQDRLKSDEILVTSMTTPDFLPCMERAAAFVTDEGGITCHATIVAREMRKPCIIGTKIATKVLKDGDMVEVDAEKGVVKIIKKADA